MGIDHIALASIKPRIESSDLKNSMIVSNAKEDAMAKAMLVNGSPHKSGCTNRALDEIERTLKGEGIQVERFWIGTKPIAGCIACGYCSKHDGECTFGDIVNEFNKVAEGCDAFVFGSPVYYASTAGQLRAFMDRSFYSDAQRGKDSMYVHKVAASISSARRAGNTSAFDEMNKYFTIREMFIAGSSYWNMVFGSCAEDVEKDEEGLRTMRVLGKNIAYLLKCIDSGKASGVKTPEEEAPARTNFIR